MDELRALAQIAAGARSTSGTAQVVSGTVLDVTDRSCLIEVDGAGRARARTATETTPAVGERVVLLRDVVSGVATVIGFVRPARRVGACTATVGAVVTNELVRAGDVVHGTLMLNGVAFSAGMIVGQVPVGFRPVRRVVVAGGTDLTDGIVNLIRVDSDGSVEWLSRSGATDRVRLTGTWISS